MCKALKICVKFPFAVLFGVVRFIGFILALSAVLNNFLIGIVEPGMIKWEYENISAVMLSKYWKWFAMVFEGIVCVLIMADTVVTTDRPFGNAMDEYSFLYLLKVPPASARGLMWLIMLALPCTELLSFFSFYYSMSVIIPVMLVLNIGRKIIILPVVVYSIVSICRNWKVLIDRKDIRYRRSGHERDNHWQMLRYYEDEDFKPTVQRPKQRVEKVIMLTLSLCLVTGHVFNLLSNLQVLSFFASSPNNSLPNTTETLGTLFAHFLVGEQRNTANNLLYYLDTVSNAGVKMFLSFVLALYMIVRLCQSHFVPVHTTVKLLLLYNLLVALPSDVTVTSLVQSVVGRNISADASLWLVACVPFLFLLQTIPYIVTRSVYSLFVEVKNAMKSLLTILLNFCHYSKRFRLLHTLFVVFGMCALMFLLLGLPLPWIKIDFQPDNDLGVLFDMYGNLQETIKEVLVPFENLRLCIPMPENKYSEQIKVIKDDHSMCFNSYFHLNKPKHCDKLKVAVINASAVQNSLPKDCLPLDDCPIYLLLMTSGIALAQVPFGGGPGTLMMKMARTVRKMFRLRKKLMKVEDTFQQFLSALQDLIIFFKRPIATKFFSFTVNIHLFTFFLPCILICIICISTGFWKRQVLKSGRKKVTYSFLAFLLFFANSATLTLSFVYKPFIMHVYDLLPLVTLEITELLGWYFIKAALLSSTIAAGLMWINSLAGVICDNQKCYPCSRHTLLSRKKHEEFELKGNVSGTKRTVKGSGEILERNEQHQTEGQKEMPKLFAKSGFLLSTRVWIMPLFTVTMAAFALYLIVHTTNDVFIIYPRLTGKMGKMLATLHEKSKWSVYYFKNAKEEKSLCSLIASIALLPFLGLFNALTPDFLEAITGFDSKLTDCFSFPSKLAITAYRGIFVGPLACCIFFFAFGTIISLLPFIGNRKKLRFLLVLKKMIFTLICFSLNVTFSATEILRATLSDVPMLEVTVESGPVIRSSIVATVLLVLAYIELCIGVFGPVI